MARVTFAIPYFRGEELLLLAIESVRRQTCADWKLIVVDDKGGESAMESVESLGDPRISYVLNGRNLGLAGNWNRCIELSETEFVTILHADDELGEDYLELVLRLADQCPQAAAYHCRAEIIDMRGSPVASFRDFVKEIIRPRADPVISKGQIGLISLLIGDWIFCPTLCYRTKVLRSFSFDTGLRFAADLKLIAELLFAGERIIGSRSRAYRYRRHDESQTSLLTRSQIRFDEELALMADIAESARESGWRGAHAMAKLAPMIRMNMIWHFLAEMRQRSFGESLKLIRRIFSWV
jgi:glycosyltransferase involved in cell wall biosynthesis